MNESEIESVRLYLSEHFVPIVKLVGASGLPPQFHEIAVRSATRHIFHWEADRRAAEQAASAAGAGTTRGLSTGAKAAGNGGHAHVEDETVREVEADEEEARVAEERRAAYAAAKAENREPDAWVTGDEPATAKQREVLRDRFIPHAESITKAEASHLITTFFAAGRVSA